MPVMPSDSPSSPSDYDAVATQDMNIQAELQTDAIQSQYDASVNVAGAGVLYPMGPRQAETERLLNSNQGYADFDITAGYSGDWPNDTTPGG